MTIMKVKVLYFANFKDITGKDSELLELSQNTVEGLISKILSKYESIKSLIWDNNKKGMITNISLVINDQIIQEREKDKLELNDGDKIAFLLPFSGG